MSFALVEIVSAREVVFERFDRAEVRIRRSDTSAAVRDELEAILNALAQIAPRDRFALTVEISGDAQEIGDLAKRDVLIEHIRNFHADGEPIDFRIELLKGVEDQRLSVYWPTALGAYLETTQLDETLIALSKRFEDRLIFEHYADSLGTGSNTLPFVKAGNRNPAEAPSLSWRQRSLSLLQDNSFKANSIGTMVPQDFSVRQAIGVPALDAFMARAGATLSAMFLSNFSDLRGNRLTYRINGYKLLTDTTDNLAELVDEEQTLQKIADWAYGEEGNSDKIGLARNVISLCVKRLEEIPNNRLVWDAIQSNYQIYLKENIATYLEVRNKLAELLAESTHKTHSLVEGLLDSIRNGVLVILTFLLTVVVINGLKDTGLHVIFSVEYLAIAVAVLVLSSLAIWASCRDAHSRFEQSARATTDLLQRMYAHVMIATELEQHVGPTIDDNRAYMKRQAKKYQKFWFIFAFLVALAFWGGHKTFGGAVNPSDRQLPVDQTRPADTHGEREAKEPSPRPPAVATLPAAARPATLPSPAQAPPAGRTSNEATKSIPRKHEPAQ